MTEDASDPVKKLSPEAMRALAEAAARRQAEQTPQAKPVSAEARPQEVKSSEESSLKPAPSAQANVVTLPVRAKKNNWLQVRADNVVVFQSAVNKGDVETWNAEDRMEISGKNLNDLDFEVNGKMIGSLGKSERLARKLIVSKDGLTVKK